MCPACQTTDFLFMIVYLRSSIELDIPILKMKKPNTAKGAALALYSVLTYKQKIGGLIILSGNNIICLPLPTKATQCAYLPLYV